MKVSDKIAEYLENRGVKHVFGIIGAGNVHIFNSVLERGYTQIICVHNEQAATMAIQTYYRTCGIVTAAILTTGAGSTNGVTGVVSAWADSIPCVIISGNENSKYMLADMPHLRMYGTQGYDSHTMVNTVTKYNVRVEKAEETLFEIEKAFDIAIQGRPGPCWVDVPMNLQSSNVEDSSFLHYSNNNVAVVIDKSKLNATIDLLKQSKRPVLWLGHGVRLSGAEKMVKSFVEELGVPTLVSWAAIDIIDSEHPLVYGRAGVYGQRAANFVLQNCDLLLCIGTRLAIPQVGYDISEFAREAKIVVIDIDEQELLKYKERYNISICTDAKLFMVQFQEILKHTERNHYEEWIKQCDKYRKKYPFTNNLDHPDTDGYINSYPFLYKLSERLKDNEIVVTDMGTALLSGHQVMKFKEGQRLMTSTGLGEMGYGLPAAMGASFATNNGSVICLNCDGGMMLNLQELQTIVHHKLPIKIFIFNNEGYLMIKHTQKSLFKGKYSGTDPASGVSCPDFGKLAAAFNIKSFVIKSWDDFESVIPQVLDYNGTVICEVFMHPEQYFFPKLSLAVRPDGTLVSPPLEDLSPLLSRDELEENMIIGLHPKSELL